MRVRYNPPARKCPVILMLNEDLVMQARGITDNLSGVVESLLADFFERERERQQRMAKVKIVATTIVTWNDFNTRFGSFADEHSTL